MTIDKVEIDNKPKLDTIENIFSHLYLDTNWESWLSYRSWELCIGINVWIEHSDKEMATIIIPEPFKKENTFSYSYTWNFETLKNLLTWKHISYSFENLHEFEVNWILKRNIELWTRSVLIITSNLNSNTFNVFEVAPNWENFSVPLKALEWVQSWVKGIYDDLFNSWKNDTFNIPEKYQTSEKIHIQNEIYKKPKKILNEIINKEVNPKK